MRTTHARTSVCYLPPLSISRLSFLALSSPPLADILLLESTTVDRSIASHDRIAPVK